MGSILQFFDTNQANSSRKLVSHKKQIDGFDAPRNSLEFYNERSHNFDVIQEDIPYSCQVKQQSSKMSYRSNEYQMKRLIDEELSKRTASKREEELSQRTNNKRSSTPSIVARLMGMDALPSETKPTAHAKEWNNEKPRGSLPRKESSKLSSFHHTSSDSFLKSSSTKNAKQDLLPYDSSNFKLAKPLPREHPQAELLDKFKKDFVAWQKSKVWEHSRALETDTYLRQTKSNQILAQENLNKEKMARYCESRTQSTHKKPAEPRGHYVPKGQSRGNSEQLTLTRFSENEDMSSSPTKIVILRPSVDRVEDIEGSLPGSPEILGKESSMQEFLEEVKEKLKYEILGKAKNTSIETSFGKRSGDTKQFARHVAKHIRESVTRDLGTSLIHSESTRSYGSEMQFNAPEFPEFVTRDTRRVLSDRLKNVMRNASNEEIPLARSRVMQERVKSRSMHDFPKFGKKPGYLEDKKLLNEYKIIRTDPRSEPASPINLARSFSAPVSGTAFAKLLLEDHHMLTGAHIQRKHETSENSSPESSRKKKDSFNLKGTVSTLRHNFTLRRKFFGKKTHAIDESTPNEFDSYEALMSAPTVVGISGILQDNSTEVPPSPASVSSSSPDDFCRPGLPSPVSPLQAYYIEDHFAPKVSTESSSVFPEPADLPQHVEHSDSEEVATKPTTYKDEVLELEGDAQAYIRNILITSGLYEDESLSEVFPKWDASTKPIPKWVFEEVEEAYNQKEKCQGDASLLCCLNINISRELLFDLINDALPNVLKPPRMSSTLRNYALGPGTIPQRKNLLDDLWWQIKVYVNSPKNEQSSVDAMVAQNVRVDPWCSQLHDDLFAIGRKMELVILRDLIDELVHEMRYNFF